MRFGSDGRFVTDNGQRLCAVLQEAGRGYSQACVAAEDLAAKLNELEEARVLISEMTPVVKAAIKWAQSPALDDESEEEEKIAACATDLELALATEGTWEELPDGRWRRKPLTGNAG